MEDTNLQKHWENVYTKQEDQTKASWYQEQPRVVIDWIKELVPDHNAPIIDIGGGDSLFTDTLLNLGYQHISVLDISSTALEKARIRLGKKALKMNWICADASAFEPSSTYAVWHDRAAFHFLNSDAQKSGYKKALLSGIAPGGWVMLATFSKNGPEKCSGLQITQYSEEDLKLFLGEEFSLENKMYHDHITPGGGCQNFIYTLFKRKNR